MENPQLVASRVGGGTLFHECSPSINTSLFSVVSLQLSLGEQRRNDKKLSGPLQFMCVYTRIHLFPLLFGIPTYFFLLLVIIFCLDQ